MTTLFRESKIFTICPSKKNIHQSQTRGTRLDLMTYVKRRYATRERKRLSLGKRISQVSYEKDHFNYSVHVSVVKEKAYDGLKTMGRV